MKGPGGWVVGLAYLGLSALRPHARMGRAGSNPCHAVFGLNPADMPPWGIRSGQPAPRVQHGCVYGLVQMLLARLSPLTHPKGKDPMGPRPLQTYT